MASEISKLFVTVSANTKDFQTNMKGLQKSLKGIGDKVSGIGKSLSVGLTAPLVAAGVAAFAMVQAASDLGETQSKIGQIFGESGKQIEAWSATSATALGQSKQQALDAAANFATFGKSAGLSGDDLVGFSTELTELATDLASFNNTEPQQAIDAIGAALRGEAEPLRTFGVLLDDASLRTQAVKDGLIATTKEALTPQQKVLAAHALILEQTTDAQGDFERTSSGLANQQRILSAELKNTSADIGQALLPLAIELAGIIRNDVVPIIQSMAEKFKSLSPETIKMGATIGLVVAAIGPLLIVVGTLINLFSSLIPIAAALGIGVLPLVGIAAVVVVGIAALIAIGVLLFKNWDTIKAKAAEIWNTISAFLDTKLGKIVAIISGPIGIGLLVIKNWELIKTKAKEIFDKVAGIVKSVWEGISSTIKNSINSVIGVINKFIGGINNIKITVPSVNIPLVGKVGGFSISLPNIPSIPALQTGTNFVPQDMLAQLHEGEAVIPKEFNPNAAGNGNENQTNIEMISFERMFSGANITVRTDDDIRKLSREVGNITIAKLRGAGIL